MKFEEALKAMREGKLVKRNRNFNEYSICMGIICRKYTEYFDDKVSEAKFDSKDLLSEDWEICE
jgi:hypothetical protein